MHARVIALAEKSLQTAITVFTSAVKVENRAKKLGVGLAWA